MFDLTQTEWGCRWLLGFGDVDLVLEISNAIISF